MKLSIKNKTAKTGIKILISVLCTVIFICLTASFLTASAEQAYERPFDISVVSDDAGVDLSGIVIHVYTSEAAFSDGTGMTQYNEYPAFDVITDSNGKVRFERPSDHFSVTLDTDLFPEGYGVIIPTLFFQPYVNNAVFNVNKIDRIVSNADSVYNIDDYTVYDKSGNVLMASLESERIYDRETFKKSILDGTDLNLTLRVYKGGFEKEVDVNIDLTKNDFNRIKYLYKENLIGLEEEIELYCDSIINCRPIGVMCLDGVLYEIQQYAWENQVSEELQSKIDRVFAKPEYREVETKDEPAGFDMNIREAERELADSYTGDSEATEDGDERSGRGPIIAAIVSLLTVVASAVIIKKLI